MNIILPEDADKIFNLPCIDTKEPHEHLGRLVHIKSLSEIGILGGYADRTRSLVTHAVLLTPNTDHRKG